MLTAFEQPTPKHLMLTHVGAAAVELCTLDSDLRVAADPMVRGTHTPPTHFCLVFTLLDPNMCSGNGVLQS